MRDLSGGTPWLFATLLVACGGEAPIEQPVPLYGEEPIEYPLDLWDEGVEGEAVLRVRVTDEGAVDSVLVLETSGHVGLDSAAIRGVADLRFRPARRGDRRVDAWARVPVRFTKRPRPESGAPR